MSQGIVYVVFGKDYEEAAAAMLLASRKHTALPMHVLTNIPQAQMSPVWAEISNITFTHLDMPQDANRVIKTQLYKYTPFTDNLYLDCDTVIQHDRMAAVFAQLAESDLVMYERTHWAVGAKVPALYVRALRIAGEELPVTNWRGAVIAFNRDNPKVQRFFDYWYEQWRANRRGREMPALACAAKRAQLTDHTSIAALPAAFMAVVENDDATVQHEYADKHRKKRTFYEKFNVPRWAVSDIMRSTIGRVRWKPIAAGDELVEGLELPAAVDTTDHPDTVCIVGYLFGSNDRFTSYIPLFVYCALWSYPHAFVRIVVDGKLTQDERNGLAYIRQQLSTRFEVLENYTLPGPAHKHQRWLLPRELFDGFKYGYIGDIDMLLVKETPALLDVHLANCQRYRLPFSNIVRWQTKLPPRLSGLHFIKVDEYCL
jgi:hypothetical protein